MNINFNESDFQKLLLNISKQTELLELMYKGWTDFENDKLRYQVSDFNQKGDNDMKNITKRSDGRYVIRKVINGTRVIKYARTKEDALQILQKIKKGKIKIVAKEKTNDYTLEEYSQIWLTKYKKPFISAKSYSAVKNFILRINKVLGQFKIKNLTTEQIQEFLNSLPRSRTKEKICSYFNALLQKACETNIISHNVFNAIVKDKKLKCKNDAYTYAEQVAILNAISGTDIEHEILIYLMCGCRPNELPNKTNFDFTNNLINIFGTKNENALHRQIEMSEPFAEYMKKYFAKSEVQAESYVSRKFRTICLTIGIKNPLLYRLRHTFATNHFTLGTPPKQVQEWLGHAKISMTLDTYTDIDKTSTKDKIEKLYNNFYYIRN